MKKSVLLFLAFLLLASSCRRGDNDPRLIVISFDGLRWSEVFGGADSAMLARPDYVKDRHAAEKYWRQTPAERREALLPFIWSYVPGHGYLVGNRWLGSRMDMANRMWFSYPGYNEMFCGFPDDERITSNKAEMNANTSVFEVANRDSRYAGRVAVYGSWTIIKYALNCERGAFPASTGYDKSVARHPSEAIRLVDEMLEGMPVVWPRDRYDAFTYAYAKETLRSDHPKVMYISFCETDAWPHEKRYDRYLDAARKTDTFIRNIVETCESDPFYRGKTTYILLTDHGRGSGDDFKDHGSGAAGSGELFFAAFGKGIPALGEVKNTPDYKGMQVAATISEILGLDFVPDNGVKQHAIHPEQ